MYLSNNYVDINIYPLTMNVMRLWACLYGKGAISNDNIIIIIIMISGICGYLSQKFMHIGNEIDKMKQKTVEGWTLYDNAHFKWNVKNGRWR